MAEMEKMNNRIDNVERASFRMPQVRELQPSYWKAERFAKVLKDEGEAIEEYIELLAVLDPQEDAGAIEVINGVVAEEKKHIMILQKIMPCYDGGIKPEKDGLEEVKRMLHDKPKAQN